MVFNIKVSLMEVTFEIPIRCNEENAFSLIDTKIGGKYNTYEWKPSASGENGALQPPFDIEKIRESAAFWDNMTHTLEHK